jgi:hypothetical protein
MKHLKIMQILMVLLVFTACKKQHTITIQAQNMANLTDGSHYAGMNYVILERGYFFNHKSKTVAFGQLDANGKAVIELDMKKNLDYVLGIATPENICYTEVELEYPINYKGDNNITFNYAPCGYVNVPTNNVNCEGSDDKMQYRYYYTKKPDIYIYRGFGSLTDWSENTFVNGCVSYPGDFNSVPAGNYTFEWRVIRPSGTTTGIDYFTVTEGDTTNYLLEY